MSYDGDDTDGSMSTSTSAAAPCQRRRVKLRPVFPRFDWMMIPNTLAYIMSWYGLFIGKFPVQVLATVFGLAIIFAAGIHRIQIADIRPDDYLPTDSRSTIERSLTTMFDYSDPKDPSENPTIAYPPRTKPTTTSTTTTTTTTQSSVTTPPR